MSGIRTWLGILLLPLAACAAEPKPKWMSGDPRIGKQVAEDLCASCHAVGATGESINPAAPPLRTVLTNYRPDWLADDLHNAVEISHLKMPTFHFGDGHEYDLIAYLLTIQEKPASR
ncbi:MAG: c-type cytochrome [Hyphomonadaceae bacterium]